jgi:hypothetical protein
MRLSAPNPQEIGFFNGNFVFDLLDFDLRDVFQEHDAGVKREIPYINSKLQLIIQV